MIIRACSDDDFADILAIVNDAAESYRGVIPDDCFQIPYMPDDELHREIEANVQFWGVEHDNILAGVMGIQELGEVTLIRHAYVRPASQNMGLGAALLRHLRERAQKPLLVGTWAAAHWAIRFYERRGFDLVPSADTPVLLKKYWSITARQIETSVVLAEARTISG